MFLEERMESIFGQTFTNWELIACDSYSDDGTWEYLQQFASDPRVRLYRVPREGLYAGWNECLKRCTGKWVYFATADDTCARNFLEVLVNSGELVPEAGLAFCDYAEIDSASLVLKCDSPSNRQIFMNQWAGQAVELSPLFAFTASCHFAPLWCTMSAVVFRRSILDDIGLFPQDHGSCGDVFWALSASAVAPIVYHGECLATWRQHPDQATRKQAEYILQFQIAEALRAAFNQHAAKVYFQWSTWKHSAKDGVTYYAETRKREMLSLDHGLLRRSPVEFLTRLIWTMRRWPVQAIRQLFGGLQRTEARPVLDCLNKALESVASLQPRVLDVLP